LEINTWQVRILVKAKRVIGKEISLYLHVQLVDSSSNDHLFEVLPNCAMYIQLKLKRVTDGGDHDVAICEVVGTGMWVRLWGEWMSIYRAIRDEPPWLFQRISARGQKWPFFTKE
jgi:hypothetical protein